MDIREWLQHIADREPPEEQQKLGIPDYIQQPAVAATKHSRSRVVQRKRLSNRVPGHPKRRHLLTQLSSSDCVQRAPDSHATSRRPRHKTRADCYETKPKRKKARNIRDVKESKSKHRKSRRTGDGTRTAGLVQSFQLKNRSNNNRLTLQPEARVGIFNHGKASVPVAANGPGLPDLVFNEMKFLSRPKHQEMQVPINDASNKRKKSRKELRDEEISAYFRKVSADRQPADNVDDQLLNNEAPVRHAIQTKPQQPGPGELDDVHSSPKEQSRHTNPAKDSTDVPQKMQHARGTSGSYYTWSESIQKAQPTSLRHDHNRPSRSSHTPQRVRHKRDDGLVNEIGNPALVRTLCVARSSSRIPSTDPSLSERSRDHYRAPYLESALGSVTSAPVLQQEMARSPVAPITKSRQAAFHHTSDILALRGIPPESTRSLFLPRAREENADQENIAPLSTPTSKLLREALYAVTQPEQATPQHAKPDFAEYTSRHCRPVQESPSLDPIPCRGFTRVSTNNGSRMALHLSAAPAGPFPFSGTRFAPAVRFVDRYTEQLAEHAELVNTTQAIYRPGESNFEEYFEHGEIEDAAHGCTPAASHYLNNQDELDAGNQRDWQYPLQLGHEVDDTMKFAYYGNAPIETAPARLYDGETFMEIPMARDAAEDETVEHMSGFWRPNVLY
ncbi:hypothetical protein BST61_g3441 [Cercospora zeina]